LHNFALVQFIVALQRYVYYFVRIARCAISGIPDKMTQNNPRQNAIVLFCVRKLLIRSGILAKTHKYVAFCPYTRLMALVAHFQFGIVEIVGLVQGSLYNSDWKGSHH